MTFLLLDMRGKEIRVDEFVVDERGKVYLSMPTEKSFLKEGLIRVFPLSAKGKIAQGHTYLRAQHIFRQNDLSFEEGEQRQRALLWHELYQEYISPKVKEELKVRKQEFQARKGK